MRRKPMYYTGNTLIILSLALLIYIVYPVAGMYLFPPAPPAAINTVDRGFFLYIPKIHAYSRIVPSVDPWNRSAYMEALKQGVAQAKGTSFPDGKGMMFLFAHSSGAPWELTHTNTLFLRLPELDKNDRILVDYHGKRYIYAVQTKREVWPQETQYLKNSGSYSLILQTCTPIGTSLKRLLVFAVKVNK